jgi:large subunit ribosomal protein L22
MAIADEERVEVRAQARYVRTAARKARLVLDTIRGRSVPEARSALAFSTRGIAREIEKVLRSAVANAEQNHGLVGDSLYISACYADEGPVLKRWRPRARGRAARIHKGTCHITIRLAEIETGEAERRAGLRRRGEASLPGAAEEPRRRLRRRAAEPEAVEEPEVEVEAVEEEPGAEPEAVEQVPVAEAAGEAEAPAEAEKPRRRRAPRAKKESQTEAEAPEAPARKRTTRRKKEDER